MPNIVSNTVPSDYQLSVSPANFNPADYIVNPPGLITLLTGGVPGKYWKFNPGITDILEMTQGEKDAVDAAEATAITQGNRDQAVALPALVDAEGVHVRALIELFNKRDNYLVNRIVEIQDGLLAAKATAGGAQNTRDALPASYMATNTRTKADAIADYTADIDAGNQDT